ncbi:hypothetical protein EV356DRAFT_581619 [Viridothelium virens]|uniref:Uncharacterized protein n=1 Tax=Viridothelium virens TaxID=1048519 RepID=A0A6A6GRZ5_VIRVR|nr:hypothetical protein EV356DRAFT_581619 [Viridothelium virens]
MHFEQASPKFIQQGISEQNGQGHGSPKAPLTVLKSLELWQQIEELYRGANHSLKPTMLDHELSQGILRVHGVGQTGDMHENDSLEYTWETAEVGELCGTEGIEKAWSPNREYYTPHVFATYAGAVHEYLQPFLHSTTSSSKYAKLCIDMAMSRTNIHYDLWKRNSIGADPYGMASCRAPPSDYRRNST